MAFESIDDTIAFFLNQYDTHELLDSHGAEGPLEDLAARGFYNLYADAVSYRNSAIIVGGKSGVGKTTLTQRLVVDGETRFGEDNVWVRDAAKEVHLFNPAGAPRALPLAAILYLHQEDETAKYAAQLLDDEWDILFCLHGENSERLGRKLLADVPCIRMHLAEEEYSHEGKERIYERAKAVIDKLLSKSI